MVSIIKMIGIVFILVSINGFFIPETGNATPANKPLQAINLEKFESLKDFCQSLEKSHTASINSEEQTFECHTDVTNGKNNDIQKAVTAAPYEEIRLIYDKFDRETTYHLAIKLRGLWFVMANLYSLNNPGVMGISEDITISQFEVKELIAGGYPEIIIQARQQHTDIDWGVHESEYLVTNTIVICGMGPSAVPSCIVPITISQEADRGLVGQDENFPVEHPNIFHWDWKLREALNKHQFSAPHYQSC
jgi:hypothetical protein